MTQVTAIEFYVEEDGRRNQIFTLNIPGAVLHGTGLEDLDAAPYDTYVRRREDAWGRLQEYDVHPPTIYGLAAQHEWNNLMRGEGAELLERDALRRMERELRAAAQGGTQGEVYRAFEEFFEENPVSTITDLNDFREFRDAVTVDSYTADRSYHVRPVPTVGRV